MKNILSYKECQALKGVSILFIVLHNLLHIVTPFKENEKFFDVDNAQYYIQHFSEAPIMSFFGYFGWIGVAVFIFLTGYGLSLKYSNDNLMVSKELSSNQKPNNSVFRFILNHYKKLLTLVFIPYFIYLLAHVSLKSIINVFPDLLFIRNIFSYPDSPFGYIAIRTYWYLGMCFELYVYYALFYKCFKNKWFIILTLGISLLAITIPDAPWIRYCKYHFLGWLPAFYLGYFATKLDCSNIKVYLSPMLLIFFIPLFIFTSLNIYFWFISDVIGILCFISMAPLITNKFTSYIGVISSCIFVCHPLIRNFWLRFGNDYMYKDFVHITGYVIAYVLVCVIVSDIYCRLLKIIRSKI